MDSPWGPDPVSAWLACFVCPRCRGDLAPHARGLCCEACRLVYPVVDGVPYLVEERASEETAERA